MGKFTDTTFAVTGTSGYIGRQLMGRLSGLNQDAKRAHVVHLAARTDVVQSWSDPAGYYAANALTTINLLEKCREANCSFTYISSYSYGQPKYLPIDEEHELESVNPYGLSKVAADSIVRFYAKNYDLNANVLRLFNTYGPSQQGTLLIPEIVAQILDPQTTEIVVKDLTPKRDYIYITDVIEAIMRISMHGKGEAFNLGYGQSHSVEEILVELIRLSGRSISYRSETVTRRNEIPDVVSNIDKLKKFTNWSPEVDLSTGLKTMFDIEAKSLAK